MAFSLHGVHVPHRKKTATKAVAHMPAPATVTIPMLMHIGKPATPIVKVGDTVFVGTKIGEAAVMVLLMALLLLTFVYFIPQFPHYAVDPYRYFII